MFSMYIGAAGPKEILQLANVSTTLCPWGADWWTGYCQGNMCVDAVMQCMHIEW